jgi:hypothetical protein
MSGRTSELILDLTAAHVARQSYQAGLRTDLERTGAAVLGLPLLTGASFGVEDLEVLADVLAVQVGEDGPRARARLDAAGLAAVAGGVDR